MHWTNSGLKAQGTFHISKSQCVYWKCHLIESDLGPSIGWQRIYKFTRDSRSKVSHINIMKHLHGGALEIMHHANDGARWMRWFQRSPHPSPRSHPRGRELRLCSHIHFPPLFCMSLVLYAFLLRHLKASALTGSWDVESHFSFKTRSSPALGPTPHCTFK